MSVVTAIRSWKYCALTVREGPGAGGRWCCMQGAPCSMTLNKETSRLVRHNWDKTVAHAFDLWPPHLDWFLIEDICFLSTHGPPPSENPVTQPKPSNRRYIHLCLLVNEPLVDFVILLVANTTQSPSIIRLQWLPQTKEYCSISTCSLIV